MLAFGDDNAVLWVPRIANGELGFEEAARIAVADPARRPPAPGRAAIEALPRVAYGGPVTEREVVVALAARARFCARRSPSRRRSRTTSRRRSRTTSTGTRRSSPTSCISTQPSSDAIRRGRRSGSSGPRRSGQLVDLARRRAESWGAVVVGVTPDRRPAARRSTRQPAQPAAVGRAAGGFGVAPPGDLGAARADRVAGAWSPSRFRSGRNAATPSRSCSRPSKARLQAEASSALRDQLEQLTGDYNFALPRKYAFPSAVQVVDDVTKLLPDDTWLTQFEVKSTVEGQEPSREILLRGESANAGRLISLLEDSNLFERGGAALADDQDPARPRRDLRSGRAAETLPPPARAPGRHRRGERAGATRHAGAGTRRRGAGEGPAAAGAERTARRGTRKRRQRRRPPARRAVRHRAAAVGADRRAAPAAGRSTPPTQACGAAPGSPPQARPRPRRRAARPRKCRTFTAGPMGRAGAPTSAGKGRHERRDRRSFRRRSSGRWRWRSAS